MRFHRFFATLLLFVALASWSGGDAYATLVWDPDNDQVSNGGAGTWDTTSSNWDNDGSAPNDVWDNTGAQAAEFGDAGANYNVSVAPGSVVTVGDVTYQGTNVLTFTSALGDSFITLAGNATWDTGGGNIQFASNQSGAANLGDVGLNLAGNTLTVNGGGTFDAGERGNGVNWGSGNLVFTEATTVRGANYNISQLNSVTMAGGSSFIMERNSNQDINNDWVLNGDVIFDNRFNGRISWVNGEISGTGRLIVQGMGTAGSGGSGYLRINNTANSFSGGVRVNGGINNTVLHVNGSDATLGAVPASVDDDNIILQNNGGIQFNNIATLNSNRGITLDNGGRIIISTASLTYGGKITGTGPFRVGQSGNGNANRIILTSDSHDYTGDTLIQVGRIQLGIDNALPNDTLLVIGGGGSIAQFEMEGFDQEVRGLTLAGNNTRRLFNNGASESNLTINVPAGEDYVFGGDINGASAINFIKEGLGAQTYQRNPALTAPLGGITVNEGTFDVSAATALGTMTGDVTVNGGVLGVNGTLGGAVTVNAGTLSPGVESSLAIPVATANLNDGLVLQAAAVLAFNLEGADTTAGSSTNDLIAVIGDLTLDGTLNVTEPTANSFLDNAVEGDSWTLLTYTGTLIDNGLEIGTLPNATVGFEIDTSTAGIVSLVAIAAVPEPSQIVALGLLLCGLVTRRSAAAKSRC